MGRYTEISREKIDATVEQWRERCLLADQSLLFGDVEVWSAPNLDELHRRFVDERISGDQSFYEKLEEQLGDAERATVRLAAETFLVYALFVTGAINPDGKRSTIRKILSLGEPPADVPDEEQVGWQAMEEGIGNPGGGYNFRRPTELRFLIEATRSLKDLDKQRVRELLDDPWSFQAWLDEQEGSSSQFRHVWLHLLYPDVFERIASSDHKRRIVDVFGGVLVDGQGSEGEPEASNEENIDRQLLAIRNKLRELLPKDSPMRDDGRFDFYHSPLREAWFGSEPGDQRALEFKGQLVYYGSPGTSKSHDAEQLARSLIRSIALKRWGVATFFTEHQRLEEAIRKNVHYLQLHPAYSYEEFIGGLTLTEAGTVYQPGYLPRLVEQMKKERDELREKALPHVVILDEMNRADLSRVLGEAFSLLERDKRGESRELTAVDPGSEDPPELEIPADLYFIGTMNLIDQSVEQVDFALRRRFLWRELRFERDRLLNVLHERWEGSGPPVHWDRVAADMDRLATCAELLNARIGSLPTLGPEYEIGHTYFFDIVDLLQQQISSSRQRNFLWGQADNAAPTDALREFWALALRPLLEQYLAGVDADQRTGSLRELEQAFLAKP